MRLYVEVVRTTARRMATYRGATLAGVITNSVFGFILAYVLLAVFRERSEIGGFDSTDAITFTFVTQGMLMVTGIFGSSEQADAIAKGDVAMELSRPYDYQAWWLSVWLGKAAFYAVFRGVPPFVIGALVFHLRLPSEPATWVTFAISVALGSAVAFTYGFIISCSAFWLLDVRGPTQLAWFTAQFLAGVFVPIVFFPDSVLRVARLLPFAAMIQLPVEVFLEKWEGLDIVSVWARQVFWFLALAALGRFVLSRAVRKVVIQGG